MEKKIKLLEVDKASNIIFKNIKPIKRQEKIKIENSIGRILLKTVKSKRNQPSLNLSSMDGFAVRKQDIDKLPKKLDIIEEIKAGDQPRFDLKKNQASRIYTGASIPKGSNKVIIQENCIEKKSKILINKNNKEDFIRKKASDFSTNFKLKAPRIITSRDIALLGAMNQKNINVYCKPRIAIIANGNELIEIGEKPNDFKQPSSSKPSIMSLIQDWGGEAIDLGIAEDNIKDIEKRIKKSMKYDLIITIGGASVGKYDLIHQSLKDLGFKLNFWKIAMQPGKPLMFGTKNKVSILGLPGNPVSALVCSEIFLKKAIYALQGYNFNEKTYTFRLASSLNSNSSRRQYIRGILFSDKRTGEILIKPLKNQDSAALFPYSQSNALIIREPYSPTVKKGSRVNVILLKN